MGGPRAQLQVRKWQPGARFLQVAGCGFRADSRQLAGLRTGRKGHDVGCLRLACDFDLGCCNYSPRGFHPDHPVAKMCLSCIWKTFSVERLTDLLQPRSRAPRFWRVVHGMSEIWRLSQSDRYQPRTKGDSNKDRKHDVAFAWMPVVLISPWNLSERESKVY